MTCSPPRVPCAKPPSVSTTSHRHAMFENNYDTQQPVTIHSGSARMKSKLLRDTIRSSFSVAISAAFAAGLSGAPVAFGQDEADQRFGTVHFATSCNETAQRRFDRGMRY